MFYLLGLDREQGPDDPCYLRGPDDPCSLSGPDDPQSPYAIKVQMILVIYEVQMILSHLIRSRSR